MDKPALLKVIISFTIPLILAGCSFDYEWGSDRSSKENVTAPTASEQSTVNTSSVSEWTVPDPHSNSNSIVNGRLTLDGIDIRYSARSINGVEARLETTTDVIFKNGLPIKWPDHAVVKLRERKENVLRVGEMRANGSKLELWMKNADKFERGSKEDESWASRLLLQFKLDDTPEPEKKKDAAKFSVADPNFAKKLETLHYQKDVLELVRQKSQAGSLSAKEQISLIDIALNKLHYEKDKMEILLLLIHRPDFSKVAKVHLIDHLDEIHYAADQKKIQKALLQ